MDERQERQPVRNVPDLNLQAMLCEREHVREGHLKVPLEIVANNNLMKMFRLNLVDVSLPANQVENEQEAIKLPIGLITRARAKRFKDAISALVDRIEEKDSKELRDELNSFNFFEVEFRSS
ncbi:hypothetical protein GOBAR_DD30506 [Gossypium barbadense]|nr:hypothetical protein GOBAR_DD30506 [Gossypium barbadense]